MTGQGKNNAGFTLVELAIVIIISGLITAIIFDALHYQAYTQQRETTLDNIAAVQAAINEYKGVVGNYPCPATPNLPEASAAYGTEQRVNPGLPTTTCSGPGVTLTPGFGGNTVAIGTVPFATIAAQIYYTKLSNNQSLDGWGNRLTYAVTLSQAKNASTFRDENGAVQIIDENDNPVIYQPGTTVPAAAHYAVISHGDNGRGAYSKTGTLVSTCGTHVTAPAPPPPAPPQSAATEDENCDNNGTFLAGLRNLSTLSYNDDIVKFTTVQRSNIWATINNTANILRVSNTNLGKVGIGIDPSLVLANTGYPPQSLDVAGPFQAGDIYATRFCDQGGANCTKATFLGGPAVTGTNSCPVGEVMTGVDTNTARCAPVFTAPIAKSCAAGEYMAGISNKGHAKCWNATTQTVTIE